MKLVRFNGNRLGLWHLDGIEDITSRFDLALSWPALPGDAVVRQFYERRDHLDTTPRGELIPHGSVRLDSPVANPSKIIGAPVNYKAHIDEANSDTEINTGKVYTTLDAYGLFLKANSSLAGPSDGFPRTFPDRRTDHEVEMAVVIGAECKNVDREEALHYVAGYSIGLDMSLRGPEVPSYRKSPDGYAILGPWLVSPDEVPDPDALRLQLSVNGDVRQASSTAYMLFDTRRIIEYASRLYTLYPGDIIMTGTPDGVGPVHAGDQIHASVESLGELLITVTA
ncbi:fumarylacetoacetate hydrolase family protein [Xanthobacter dioxanivorans]|uniref:Fumarylacetoacetate hydrolase family protein n=1 Tax=Xanthobacter dioxanivorans TaxID=2528964 RepID=A0A974SLC8_9HYPH|nr:fumarylacetoacetate hydrolase family protein [Xanthobacter dioxanivorans]QRG08393.1 fumarylacetoacetate hydrolase family protein [Xanthobacter dioxanivorans]